ncbi:bifunctional glutamate--cysteine ligase GshA/glutathione synthetase GshB [Acetobacterium wieringae]|uniref:Bifunctional glutamate--cysteine ligase GshA/glutathione synthetase GshB n=1 Tax=Acetobacterium wieringae TaxID=52694 RepID=A0ABY6HI35_9FIRM|nr:bifunctional glutamate--cysteine ligase GshA/glutathione synthetase GshB [Acetobacterium wieringae]UYO64083.1 bifunctional glutamate--cysteine ligase GshA/glutathione synthetase GshB [Acetobacterium wieringae]VUZ25603.1 Glutathione biosynthesis bifunctional protein GshAB [Acetobacterium wieringae]
MFNNQNDGLELSTAMLIDAAKQRGITVEILDAEDNFIRLTKGNKSEYIKQATRTSADTYITPLIMENKEVTKLVLREKGINVPAGIRVKSATEAMAHFENFRGRDVVVKPKSTNFGLGIEMFKNLQCASCFQQAVVKAFEHDTAVLIEEFVPGKEYRFLVIGDAVVGILHRVPANVVGDGVHSIAALVAEKNRSPLRGKGYVTPLEKLRLETTEIAFLSEQSKSLATIPAAGETVYLRENSNISTGGDSIDFTDAIIDDYKAIAVKAAQAVGAKICGADIIIKDLKAKPDKTNYSIIELNFNPALHIHNYPFVGENRHVDDKVLDLLGF